MTRTESSRVQNSNGPAARSACTMTTVPSASHGSASSTAVAVPVSDQNEPTDAAATATHQPHRPPTLAGTTTASPPTTARSMSERPATVGSMRHTLADDRTLITRTSGSLWEMAPKPAPDELAEMRLDDLAAAAGVATTTVRLYRQRGLLPPPRLVGRTGWFGPHHLARLRLIARLQGDGFSLAGIGKLLT